MNEIPVNNLKVILEKIHGQIKSNNFRITQHTQQEMAEEDIFLNDILEAANTGQILENYPAHRRGACCLISGLTLQDRPLHIVCTSGRPELIIITVYEPKPPKWLTPTQRRKQK